MQRLMFSLSAFGVFTLAATAAFAEGQISAEEQFSHDVELCTEQANSSALDTDGDGDAKAIFYRCMTEKGHAEDALDAIGEEQ